MSRLSTARIRTAAAVFLVALIAIACGGGGGGTAVLDSAVDGAGAGSISGAVAKGPVSNASVAAYGMSGGLVGARIGSATTDASGNFIMATSGYSGPVMLMASGGSYRDEATGTVMQMAAGDVLTAVMPAMASGSTVNGIQVTPVTGMAQMLAQHMAGGLTDANIAAANAAMGNYFSVGDILHVQPMNPLNRGSGAGASVDARNYGMTLAAMSQYARSLNMPFSSAMATAMMNDASDGMMDGRTGGSQIPMGSGSMMGTGMMASTAGTGGLSGAMGAFMNSAANVSGLTAADMAALMQKLSGSGGKIL